MRQILLILLHHYIITCKVDVHTAKTNYTRVRNFLLYFKIKLHRRKMHRLLQNMCCFALRVEMRVINFLEKKHKNTFSQDFA